MLSALYKLRNICVMAGGVLATAWDTVRHRHREPK